MKKTVPLSHRWKFCLIVILLSIGFFFAPEQEIQVYLFLGQSNMVGYKTDSSRLHESVSTPPQVKIFKHDQWELYTFGKEFGPELSASRLLAGEEKVGIIKLAVNGTSMFAWSPMWSKKKAELTDNASAGGLYKKLLRIVGKAKKTKNAKVRAVFWMQGETDSKFKVAAIQYKHNMIELITALRRDLGISNLPFIIGKIDPPYECCPYRNMVRKAQVEVTNQLDNIEIVSIDDLNRQADQLHLNENGQIALGKRFVQAYLELERLN